MNNVLMAAAGEVCITPEEEIGLSGFDPLVNVANPPHDVLDDLFARSFIVDDGTPLLAKDDTGNRTSGSVVFGKGLSKHA